MPAQSSLWKRFPLVCISLIFLLSLGVTIPVSAASAPTVRTTLTDGMVQKGSRKTFDVWARDGQGNKIDATVTLNGEAVPPAWNDTDKASYTLSFTKAGQNTVQVRAAAGGQTVSSTYHITYKEARKGEVIGQAVWSVELFTIGCGYLVEPVKVDIREGENAAAELIRVLHDHGYVGYYGGSLQKSFYLAYIGDGTQTGKKYNGYVNSRQENGAPAAPKTLELQPKIPAVLDAKLQKLFEEGELSFYDPDDYRNWKGYIGEFILCNGSGWMYSVNSIFPNVGFADSYLSDGDVVRVQYTLAYGHDIGGSSAAGEAPGAGGGAGGYYSVANKDRLSALMAQTREAGLSNAAVQTAYTAAADIMMTVDASQSQVNAAYATLSEAVTEASKSAAPTTVKTHAPSTAKAIDSPSTKASKDAPSGSTVRPGGSAAAGSATEVTGSTAAETAYADAYARTTGMTEEQEQEPSAGKAWICWLAGGILVVGGAFAAVYLLFIRKKPL